SLRLAAGSRERETIGSVTIDVEVPKFDSSFSLSGALVASSSAPMAAPRDALSLLVPFAPTAQRVFGRADTVEVFVRMYEGRAAAMTPVTVTWRIRDASDRTVAQSSERYGRDRLTAEHPADLQYPLPLADLEP